MFGELKLWLYVWKRHLTSERDKCSYSVYLFLSWKAPQNINIFNTTLVYTASWQERSSEKMELLILVLPQYQSLKEKRNKCCLLNSLNIRAKQWVLQVWLLDGVVYFSHYSLCVFSLWVAFLRIKASLGLLLFKDVWISFATRLDEPLMRKSEK